MNIHAQPNLTSAEASLVEAFSARVSDLPGDGRIAELRDEAIERLKAGLPTRKVEAWHYTDLKRLLTTVPAYDSAASENELLPIIKGSKVFAVNNGKAKTPKGFDGVSAKRLRDEMLAGRFADSLSTKDPADTIGAMNAAFVSDGYALDIEAGAKIETPIELQNLQAGGQVHSRFPVTIGDNASVTVIERQTGRGDALVSSVSDVGVGDGAKVLWLIVQDQPQGATQLGQFRATLGKDSSLVLFIMNAGGKLVRQEVRVDAAGEGADFRLRGVNLLSGETHCDVTMVLDHSAPHTVSTEVFRNVVTDKAKGVFQGQIRVDRLAQKTDAKMSCNTLLLSDDGEFSAKPELEIFADDVVCGHGATVTEIDHNHLFYLMARGVPEKEARGLLVRAFVAELIEELKDEAIVEALETRLTDWFSTHG